MVLAYAILILIFVALVLRRDLSAIGKLSYRGGWMLPGLVVALFGLQWAIVVANLGQAGLQIATLILSQIALIILLLWNYHLPGAKLFALGVALNVIVIIANGGWMPLTQETYHYIYPDRTIEIGARMPNSKSIILPQEETTLWVLSDIIRVAVPWRRWAVSIGDLLIVVAVAQFIFQTSSSKEKKGSDIVGQIIV